MSTATEYAAAFMVVWLIVGATGFVVALLGVAVDGLMGGPGLGGTPPSWLWPVTLIWIALLLVSILVVVATTWMSEP